MATIQFKGKIQTVHNHDNTIAYRYIPVPQFDRKHCDMSAFRKHRKYGAYANSDLFKGMLARIKGEFFKSPILRLDTIPAGVTVDDSKFLAVVTLEV